MKKRKRILKTTLLLLLCIALAILTGCGGTNGSEAGEDIRLDPAELTEENSFPIRIRKRKRTFRRDDRVFVVRRRR